MRCLFQKVLRHRWGKKGQSTAEYIIIVALVAIGSIAIITIFGNQIRALFGGAQNQLAGDANATPTQFSSGGEETKTLTNY